MASTAVDAGWRRVVASYPIVDVPDGVPEGSLSVPLQVAHRAAVSAKDVGVEQVIRDAARDAFILNNERFSGAHGSAEALLAKLEGVIVAAEEAALGRRPATGGSVPTTTLLRLLRAANRTASGGAAFQVVLDVLQPSAASALHRFLAAKLPGGVRAPATTAAAAADAHALPFLIVPDSAAAEPIRLTIDAGPFVPHVPSQAAGAAAASAGEAGPAGGGDPLAALKALLAGVPPESRLYGQVGRALGLLEPSDRGDAGAAAAAGAAPSRAPAVTSGAFGNEDEEFTGAVYYHLVPGTHSSGAGAAAGDTPAAADDAAAAAHTLLRCPLPRDVAAGLLCVGLRARISATTVYRVIDNASDDHHHDRGTGSGTAGDAGSNGSGSTSSSGGGGGRDSRGKLLGTVIATYVQCFGWPFSHAATTGSATGTTGEAAGAAAASGVATSGTGPTMSSTGSAASAPFPASFGATEADVWRAWDHALLPLLTPAAAAGTAAGGGGGGGGATHAASAPAAAASGRISDGDRHALQGDAPWPVLCGDGGQVMLQWRPER